MMRRFLFFIVALVVFCFALAICGKGAQQSPNVNVKLTKAEGKAKGEKESAVAKITEIAKLTQATALILVKKATATLLVGIESLIGIVSRWIGDGSTNTSKKSSKRKNDRAHQSSQKVKTRAAACSSQC